jgi:dihydropteroate synthase
MSHNVLVMGAALPRERAARRPLGLGPAPAGGAMDGFSWCRVEGLGASEAHRLASAMRAAGGSAAPAPARRHEPLLRRLGAPPPRAAVVLEGTGRAFQRLSRAARRLPPSVFEEIAAALDAARAPSPPPLRLRDGRRLGFDRPLVMGILNITPDSFSDGGRHARPAAALRHALDMAEAGADLIDLGGESTRPGSAAVSLDEELRRVLPVLEALVPALRRRTARPLISIDTTKAEVARRAAQAGADLLNDISGMTFDPAMPAVAAEHHLPVVLQHLRGRPATMQRAPRYRLLLPEVAAHLRAVAARARAAGVGADRIVIDPGFGFGKKRAHSLALIRHLGLLRSLGHPILAGTSRKSFLRSSDGEPPAARIEATLASEALVLAGGAAIIRVHDVRAAARAARMVDAVRRGSLEDR